MGPTELERWVTQRADYDRVLTMRGSLSRHFPMREIHDLGLLDLCRLYADLPPSEREF